MSIEVMAATWKHSSQKGNALLVLLALADNAQEDSRLAWPSVGTLARKARMSERTVQRMLRELETAGEIVTVRGGGMFNGVKRSTVYRVEPKGCQSVEGCQNGSPTGDKPGTGGVSALSPKPSREPSEEPSEISSILEVFHHWQQVMGRQQSKLTAARKKKVRDRLHEGYSVERLKRAIDGCHGSDWNMGRDPKTGGKIFDDLELICRDGGQVERFERMPAATERKAGKYDHLG